MIGRLSVGATFQLGAKLGVGYSGGIRNAILISDTSVSSLSRPHMPYLPRPHYETSLPPMTYQDKIRALTYLSSQASSMRQLLMMLFAIIVHPFTWGCQQYAKRL